MDLKDDFPPLCWLDDCINGRGLPHATRPNCQKRTHPVALLASLNVALWGENGHTYARGAVDRVYAWLDEHCQPEVCICAALLLDNGRIIRGHRHDDCMHYLHKSGHQGRVTQEMQGFVTSRNRWVSREEGARLQNAAGVVSAMTQQPISGILFSEDLY